MMEHAEDAGRRSLESARRRDRREDSQDRSSSEPVRRKDHREASRRRLLSDTTSCHLAQEIQTREVMAAATIYRACRQIARALWGNPANMMKIDHQVWQIQSQQPPAPSYRNP